MDCPWGVIVVGAALLSVLLIGRWEIYWRSFGVAPSCHNSNGEWAQWEQIVGERPIEGTSPVPMLEDLAADPNFTGRLLVGVAPQVFFGGLTFRGDA